jgi:hypothetical protein
MRPYPHGRETRSLRIVKRRLILSRQQKVKLNAEEELPWLLKEI